MTTNLLFGKRGLEAYFTPYVTQAIPDGSLQGYVGDRWETFGNHVWYLNEDGQLVDRDPLGNNLKAISMGTFLDAAEDDNSETDDQQWSTELLDWASATQFDTVVVCFD